MELSTIFTPILTAILAAICIWLGTTVIEMKTKIAILETKLDNVISILKEFLPFLHNQKEKK